ncbi:DUF2625 domain-containing protein [uncultured Chitinophaga sp.]|uniref:DUF2625 domain-containing protein n=1 Tax=uncultured Chitinophaga sp. TaxID=339340 RepID=UPI0025D833EE|nr:DUF2625 domain-containing protein [uncultured Chitinophaga sp.]
MKPVAELINNVEPGWTLVQQWIDEATNTVEILPADEGRASEALYQTQVTTRSPMGAIIHATGGLLVDHGWIRILGSGSDRLNRTLPGWNMGKTFSQFGEAPPYLLVADDVIGGLWAINGGALGNDTGNLYYLSPDALEWEETDLNYSEFLHFCFSGDTEGFYEAFRWDGWEEEVAALDGNQVFNFFPFLWTKEGQEDINTLSRKLVPIEESYNLYMDTKHELDGEE